MQRRAAKDANVHTQKTSNQNTFHTVASIKDSIILHNMASIANELKNNYYNTNWKPLATGPHGGPAAFLDVK